MTESMSAVSSLLSNCQTSDPPFHNLIKTTLPSLNTSRFHFAIQLQQALDSNRDNLDPLQVICILCAVHYIGNGGGGVGDDDSHNAFSSFLQRYHEDAVSIMTDINKDRQGSSHLSLPLLETQREKEADNDDDEIDTNTKPIYYRPLPPLSTITNCGEPAHLNLHFVHTSYPSLRYEWLQPQDPKPSTDELYEKIFHAPLEHEEEKALLLYCRQKGINARTGASAADSAADADSDEHENGHGHGALLTPANLPALVQHNPNIAIHLLLTLTPSSPHTQLYHSALVRMDITLHTMEVVYKLATNHQLTTEDLHLFVLSLFERCTKMEGGGTATSSSSSVNANASVSENINADNATSGVIRNDRKMVRLVSVFLQNLISNGIMKVEDFVEVQAFCIENSRVREANALFKLIKESGRKSSKGGSGGNGGGGKGKGGKSGRR